MSSKATHKGHCQVCGRKQNLPGGVLSKHGYTTRWGFFSGVCWGATHLPFEEDISLIEGAIVEVKVQAEGLRRQAAEIRAQADPEKCWVHAYFSPRSRHDGGYRWIQTRLVTDQHGRNAYEHPGDDARGGPRVEYLGNYGPGGLADAARDSNAAYAAHLEREAKSRDQYVEWQQGRIKDWKPTDLIPIETEASHVTRLHRE